MQQIHISDIPELWTELWVSYIDALCWDNGVDVEVLFGADFKNAKTLRDFFSGVCQYYGIDPKWKTRLILIIDELNNNAIEHGSAKGDTNSMHMQVHPKNGKYHVRISVSDTGRGDTQTNAEEMRKMQEDLKSKDFKDHHSIRWRWLFLIIDRMVDKLEFTDRNPNGMKVSIEKELST